MMPAIINSDQIEESRLTTRQRAFISHYIVCKNGSQAARLAGYSQKNARQAAVDVLSNPTVKRIIEEKLQDEDWTIVKYRRIGRELFDTAPNWIAKARFYELVGKAYGFMNSDGLNVTLSLSLADKIRPFVDMHLNKFTPKIINNMNNMQVTNITNNHIQLENKSYENKSINLDNKSYDDSLNADCNIINQQYDDNTKKSSLNMITSEPVDSDIVHNKIGDNESREAPSGGVS